MPDALRLRLARAACALALAATSARASAEGGVRKGPWLMAPRLGGITVMVEREAPGPVSVRVWEAVPAGAPEPGPIVVNDAAVAALHELRVSGLTPGARYRYEVTGPGLAPARGAFNAMPDAFAPFRFVLYGDTRGGHVAHAAVMRAVAREGADFVVHTGDLVGDGRVEAQWQRFFDIERDALRDAAWVPVVGNHELQGAAPAGVANFRRYVHSEEDSPRPELDYTLHYGNVHLVLANAFDNWTSPHMRAWLEDQLTRMRAEAPDDFLLVVLHWGMHSSANHGENRGLRAAGVADLFRRHRVDLVVAGHDHIYERGEERGLRYLVTGGSGAPLYDPTTPRPYTRVFARQHHYVRVDVEREQLTFTALRPDGSVLDRFDIRHPGARPRTASSRPRYTRPAPDAGPAAPAPPRAPAPTGGAASTGLQVATLALGVGAAALAARRRRR
ncbi:MAG: metallophosphoesterase [Polyangiales bacterium]